MTGLMRGSTTSGSRGQWSHLHAWRAVSLAAVHDAVADGLYVAECRQGGGEASLQGVQDADEGIRSLLTTFAAAAWTNLIFWGDNIMERECRLLDLSPMPLGPWSYSWRSAIALNSS